MRSAAEATLAEAPRPPRDVALFSSNTLFREPGIYPEGPPMAPADGEAPDRSRARARLGATVAADPALAARVLGLFDGDGLAAVAEPGVRAALASLVGTVGEPVLALVGAGPSAVAFGRPDSPGRVVGPAGGGGRRVVNERYRAEHPALIAPSLVHDLLWSGPGAGQYEEVVLHALVAMVHVQLVVRCPALCHLGTELARRQSSLAVTLLNSRHPGSAAISLIAPDGPGTIPGGAPAMQTPDFWSIPFVGGRPQPAPAPEALGAVVALLCDGPRRRRGPVRRYDESLGTELSTSLGRRWLPVRAQLVAAVALGLVDVGSVADRVGEPLGAVVDALALGAALACWTR